VAKSEARTKLTDVSPDAFIAAIEDARRRKDAEVLLKWMTKITGLQPRMWGPSIIGFGRYAYTYDSGHSGEMCLTGFSPRKAKMVVYVLPGFADMSGKLARLGKHKTGKSCLYINALTDVDMTVLEDIVRAGLEHVRTTYRTSDM
jgi:hypothetical protein